MPIHRSVSDLLASEDVASVSRISSFGAVPTVAQWDDYFVQHNRYTQTTTFDRICRLPREPITFTEPVSLREIKGVLLMGGLIRFNLASAITGPLIDATDATEWGMVNITIDNVGAAAGCGMLLARSLSTVGAQAWRMANVHVKGPYTGSAWIVLGAELGSMDTCFGSNTQANGRGFWIAANNDIDDSGTLITSPFGDVAADGAVSQTDVSLRNCSFTAKQGSTCAGVDIHRAVGNVEFLCCNVSAHDCLAHYKIGDLGGASVNRVRITGGSDGDPTNGIYVYRPVERCDFEMWRPGQAITPYKVRNDDVTFTDAFTAARLPEGGVAP